MWLCYITTSNDSCAVKKGQNSSKSSQNELFFRADHGACIGHYSDNTGSRIKWFNMFTKCIPIILILPKWSPFEQESGVSSSSMTKVGWH